jgi:hypothetical protein
MARNANRDPRKVAAEMRLRHADPRRVCQNRIDATESPQLAAFYERVMALLERGQVAS